MTRPVVALVFVALCFPVHALAADWAVGAGPGGLAALRAQLPAATVLVPGRTLLVHGARPHVHGAAYVSNLGKSRRSLAFANTEPDASEQWYLTADNAWSHWSAPPNLAPVKVAVIDSGIDASHPEFAGRVLGGISYVGTNWRTDTCGHGTFVAGEIAANPFNNVGIAGLAFNAELLVAKVVEPDCNVSTEGEVKAIRWAVANGARVISLSIGGTRDPAEPDLDSYSPAEQSAVEYAYSKGVLVVAAVGNGTQTPKLPWPYADYPAALPHVLGVAALRQDGSVPDYSNRDKQYVDIAAPGGPIFSTIPRNLVDASIGGCNGMPYSNCGPSEFENGIGTSFAAPQVSSAAALLLGVDPKLKPSQLEWLLERSATDSSPAAGCSACPVGRDSLTGFGALDIASAIDLLGNEHNLPTPDIMEPNDDAATPGASAHPFGPPRTITATLDYWDDPVDVYSLKLNQGDEVFARLGTGTPAPTSLQLWKPGTTTVLGPAKKLLPDRAALSASVAGQERLGYVVPVAGTYYLEVKDGGPSRPPDRYQLSVAVRKAAG
ncbi:MAG TPA: S8 family serine peptidase [Gaiellaceae bacterium]|nr:S8 family serine peptidase [Gaiellaceae bacterium]